MITMKTELMPHQVKCVDKLMLVRVGAMYMEMGTGKTRTALEIIKRRMDAGKIDKVVWLCPCSVKQNLREDILKHATGALCHIAIAGIESLSAGQRLLSILDKFVSKGKVMMIVDESNLVKNMRAIRTQRIIYLGEACKYRMILNGTPITKNEADLFSQWYFLDWRILGYQSFYSFSANHLEYDEKYKGRVRRVLNLDYLTDKIAPYTYQVSKSDCLQLPRKDSSIAYYSPTNDQRAHYLNVANEFLSTLEVDKGDDSAAIYRTFTALQQVLSGRRVSLKNLRKPITHEPFFPSAMDNPRVQCLLRELKNFDGER